MSHYARLEIYLDKDVLNAVYESLLPDNIGLPSFMELSMEIVGSYLDVRVSCDGGLDSLLNTLDDILSSVQVAVRSINSLRQRL